MYESTRIFRLSILMGVDRDAAGAAFAVQIPAVGTACRTNKIRG